MINLFSDFSITTFGWTGVHFLWISTLFLGAAVLLLRILRNYDVRLQYTIGLGSLLTLPLIPLLLLTKHTGLLPPLGFADWAPKINGAAARKPIFEGIPEFTGFELELLEPYLFWIVGCILIMGLITGFAYLLRTTYQVNRYYQKEQPLQNSWICQKVQQLSVEMDISKPPSIRQIEPGEGPAVTGILRPTLLIPSDFSERYDEQEIEVLLMHELSHVKRRDPFYAFIQRLLLTLFFFQPLAWWISKQVSRLREQVCDRDVTNRTKNPHIYGSTLIKLYLEAQAPAPHSLNISDPEIVTRMRCLAEQQNTPGSKMIRRMRSTAALIIGSLALFLMLWNSYHLHPDQQNTDNDTLQTEAVSPKQQKA